MTKQDFVREIVAQGNVRNMVRTLAVLAAAEKRKQAKADGEEATTSASEGEAPCCWSHDAMQVCGRCLAEAVCDGCAGSVAELAAAATPGAPSPAGDALREHLAELFRQFDADGNGRLDVQEFREAMKHMGNELSAASVRRLHQLVRTVEVEHCLGVEPSVNIDVTGERHLQQP